MGKNCSGWINPSGDVGGYIAFAVVNDDQCVTISWSVVILRDLQWHVQVKGQQLPPTSSEALSHYASNH